MQITIATPKSNPLVRIGRHLVEAHHCLVNRPRSQSTANHELGAYQRDRAFSASFTGSPMLPMRSHVGTRGSWL